MCENKLGEEGRGSLATKPANTDFSELQYTFQPRQIVSLAFEWA